MYYSTTKHHSIIGYWEPLTAATLIGAKRQAWAANQGDLPGAVVHVGERQRADLPVESVASRDIAGGSKWRG